MTKTLAERIGTLEDSLALDPAAAFLSTNQTPGEGTCNEKTPVAEPTGEPHRLTIYVPHAPGMSTANFGHEHESKPVGWGIFFQTVEHLHWEVADHTFVSLGGPSAEIKWSRDGVPAASSGYSMVTQHQAYMHANKQHLLKSLTKDMIIRAASDKTAVLQSDQGVAEVNASGYCEAQGGKYILVNASGAFSPETQHYSEEDPWSKQTTSKGFGYIASKVTKFISLIPPFVGSALLIGKTYKKAKKAQSGQGTMIAGAAAKLALTVAKFDTAADSFTESGADESVKVGADIGVRAFGNRNGTVYGGQAAGMGSMGAAVLSSGVTADVKGYAAAGIWGGKEAYVTSVKSTAVNSAYGSTAVAAKKTASLVADGPLRATAATAASLRAGSNAAAYGGARAYVGGGASFGLVVRGMDIGVGKISNAENFNKARVVKKNGVVLTRRDVKFKHGNEATLECNENSAFMKYKKAQVRVSNKSFIGRGKNIRVDG